MVTRESPDLAEDERLVERADLRLSDQFDSHLSHLHVSGVARYRRDPDYEWTYMCPLVHVPRVFRSGSGQVPSVLVRVSSLELIHGRLKCEDHNGVRPG